jgi:hypothetical protein
MSADKAPADARLGAGLTAMKAAKRNGDKKSLPLALAPVPDRKAAEAGKPFLSDAQLRVEAGPATMTLAQTLRKPDRSGAKDLAQAIRNANHSNDLDRSADAFPKKN